MTCETSIDCLRSIQTALEAPVGFTPADWIALFSGVVAALVAALAAMISLNVYRFDSNRVLLTERQAVREDLRKWFGGLSRSAPSEVVEGHRKLDSRIKEELGPFDRDALGVLMDWAVTVHEATFAIQDAPGADKAQRDEAHGRRKLAKWVFRDQLAYWVVRPRRGRRKIMRLSKKGYDAIGSLPLPKAVYHGKESRPSSLKIGI